MKVNELKELLDKIPDDSLIFVEDSYGEDHQIEIRHVNKLKELLNKEPEPDDSLIVIRDIFGGCYQISKIRYIENKNTVYIYIDD